MLNFENLNSIGLLIIIDAYTYTYIKSSTC